MKSKNQSRNVNILGPQGKFHREFNPDPFGLIQSFEIKHIS